MQQKTLGLLAQVRRIDPRQPQQFQRIRLGPVAPQPLLFDADRYVHAADHTRQVARRERGQRKNQPPVSRHALRSGMPPRVLGKRILADRAAQLQQLPRRVDEAVPPPVLHIALGPGVRPSR